MDRPLALLLHVVLPVAAGAAIYVGWRDESLLGWSWADASGLEESVRALRAVLRTITVDLPEPILFTLPDALWVYALTFLLARLHAPAADRASASSRLERALFLAIPIALGPGAELLQLVHALPGTFDPLDLFATLAAFFAALASSSTRDRSRRAQPSPSARAMEMS